MVRQSSSNLQLARASEVRESGVMRLLTLFPFVLLAAPAMAQAEQTLASNAYQECVAGKAEAFATLDGDIGG